MKLKRISILLLSSIISNNIMIANSFATNSIDDDRYEIIEGTDIIIDDILEDNILNISVEGNTLVNACTEDTSNGIVISDMNTRFNTSLLKPNTWYTVILDIEENNLSEDGVFLLELDQTRDPKLRVLPGETGKFIYQLRTYNDICFIPWIKNGGSVKIKNLMLLEGDWTNKEIPDYFIGMKSIGEDGDSDLVNLKIQNKNLFNNDIQIEDGNLSSDKTEAIYKYGGEISHPVGYKRTRFIKIKPNNDYRIALGTGIFSVEKVMLYDINQKCIKHYEFSNTFNSGAAKYIRITFKIDTSLYGNTYPNEELLSQNIILTEGSEKEDYIEPLSSNYIIKLKEPLRGLPSGVRDRIIKRNGKWVVERNCKEHIINGSEITSPYGPSTYMSAKQFSLCRSNYFGYNLGAKDLICESYPTDFRLLGDVNLAPRETITPYNDGSHKGSLFISISFSRAGILDTDTEEEAYIKAREWMNTQQFKVTIKRETPIYEEINDPQFISYLDRTHISSNSSIPVNIKVVVDRVANRAKEAIEIANSNPSSINIAQARYWTNLMKESTLKDSFQDQINNNTNVLDMNIEKKSTSANADVYVKLQNTLSLSLDTNNIIFDDVDSTQDTELKNAVNITVSSSLPYRVNAYLEDEIYNGDKSTTLDKSTLNIKINSDNAYKAFSNTIDPILLVDNHNEGVDISHGLDFMLSGGNTHKADVYRAIVKIEIEQK